MNSEQLAHTCALSHKSSPVRFRISALSTVEKHLKVQGCSAHFPSAARYRLGTHCSDSTRYKQSRLAWRFSIIPALSIHLAQNLSLQSPNQRATSRRPSIFAGTCTGEYCARTDTSTLTIDTRQHGRRLAFMHLHLHLPLHWHSTTQHCTGTHAQVVRLPVFSPSRLKGSPRLLASPSPSPPVGLVLESIVSIGCPPRRMDIQTPCGCL